MWNSITLGHWFLHTFFVVAHWYSCCGWNWWGNCRSGWRWGLLCWWIWLFGLRWGWLVNKVFDIFLENSSVCSSSSYFVDIKAVTFDESSDVGSGKDASINIYFFNFVGLRGFRTSFLLFFSRLLSWSWSLLSIFFHDFKEEITNLANLFLFVVYFLDDSRVGGSNFSKLFIRGNICKFLKLLDGVTLLDIEFFDGALFDFLAQIWEMELDESKAVFIDGRYVGYRMEEFCSEDEHGIDIFFCDFIKIVKMLKL